MTRVSMVMAVLLGCSTPAEEPDAARAHHDVDAGARRATIRIVSVGDSLASGEGNPDVRIGCAGGSCTLTAQWLASSDPRLAETDGRCHRSTVAGPRQAAGALRELARAEGREVEFLSFACSGAKIADLIDHAQFPEVAPQLAQVKERFPPDQPIDALLVSIGINDVGFVEAMLTCMLNPDFLGPCQDLPTFHGAGSVSARAALLIARYRALREFIRAELPNVERIYVTEYPAAATDEHGAYCHRAPFGDPLAGVERQEAEWATEIAIGTLNRTIRAEVTSADYTRLGWRMVGGIAEAFRGHGYCAGDARWILTVGDSVLRQVIPQGAVHPNEQGHAVYREALVRALTGL